MYHLGHNDGRLTEFAFTLSLWWLLRLDQIQPALYFLRLKSLEVLDYYGLQRRKSASRHLDWALLCCIHVKLANFVSAIITLHMFMSTTLFRMFLLHLLHFLKHYGLFINYQNFDSCNFLVFTFILSQFGAHFTFKNPESLLSTVNWGGCI